MLPFGLNYTDKMTIPEDCIVNPGDIRYNPSTQIGLSGAKSTYCMVRTRTYPNDSTEDEADDTA